METTSAVKRSELFNKILSKVKELRIEKTDSDCIDHLSLSVTLEELFLEEFEKRKTGSSIKGSYYIETNEEVNIDFIRFTDVDDKECNISLHKEDELLHIGADKIELHEIKSGKEFPKFDIITKEKYYIANTGVCLNREQVSDLLPLLQKFVETGKIK